jgi:riboflavin kinase/FMN adenylyltransferase
MRHNRPPLLGIFAVRVHGLDPEPLVGAASLGVRPTVNATGIHCLEVHVLDFERDVYGKHVRVEFLHKLRDEQRFPDLDTLRKQIALDVHNTRHYFRTRPAQGSSARKLA